VQHRQRCCSQGSTSATPTLPCPPYCMYMLYTLLDVGRLQQGPRGVHWTHVRIGPVMQLEFHVHQLELNFCKMRIVSFLQGKTCCIESGKVWPHMLPRAMT
jgi:hypothetical protein